MREYIMQETEEQKTFGSVWRKYKPAYELVKCKDCIHYRYYGLSEETVSEYTIDHCENPDANWFCADGVAKNINVLGKEGR